MIWFSIISLQDDAMRIEQHELPYWLEQAKQKEVKGVYAHYYELDEGCECSYHLKYSQRIA